VILKERFAPNISHNAWRMHMMQAWSSHERKNHAVYSSWSKQRVDQYVSETVELLRKLEDVLFIFNVVVTAVTSVEEIRDAAYTALILNTIDTLTEKGTQPNFFFDADRPSQGGRVVVGWAERIFEFRQRSLLYALFAKGVTIPDPVFLPPGSHPCLELADFISFWIARAHLKKWKGEQLEVDLAKVGKIFYLGLNESGRMASSRQYGLPWELFYGQEPALLY